MLLLAFSSIGGHGLAGRPLGGRIRISGTNATWSKSAALVAELNLPFGIRPFQFWEVAFDQELGEVVALDGDVEAFVVGIATSSQGPEVDVLHDAVAGILTQSGMPIMSDLLLLVQFFVEAVFVLGEHHRPKFQQWRKHIQQPISPHGVVARGIAAFERILEVGADLRVEGPYPVQKFEIRNLPWFGLVLTVTHNLFRVSLAIDLCSTDVTQDDGDVDALQPLVEIN